MKKLLLNEKNYDRFVDYVILHGKEHDESFASDEEMKKFKMGNNNPTLIITDDAEEQIIGTASMIYDEYFLRGDRTRMRIFHVLKDLKDIEAVYHQLYAFVLDQLKEKGLNHAFMFIPLSENTNIESFKQMGMTVERYVFYMENTLDAVKKPQFPENMRLKPFVKNCDEETWLKIRNESFATLTGNDTPIRIEEFKKFLAGSEDNHKGMHILYDGNAPVGIVRVDEFEENGEQCAEIGPLAVLKDYRSRGLGRNLIRAGLTYSKERGYKKVGLSVDAQNENAKKIYLDEGFKPVDSLICMRIVNNSI